MYEYPVVTPTARDFSSPLLLITGLGRLEQAEEYLMQANWTVLKTPTCSNAIKAKLYRNLGLLYAAKGDYDEALRQLADDVSCYLLLIIICVNTR